MTTMSDNMLDGGPDYAVANVVGLHMCSAEPSSYANMLALSLGNKTFTPTVGDGAPNGRAAIGAAFTDGTQTGAGTVTHYAWHNGTDEVVFSEALVSSVAFTGSGVFPLSETRARFADAVQEP